MERIKKALRDIAGLDCMNGGTLLVFGFFATLTTIMFKGDSGWSFWIPLIVMVVLWGAFTEIVLVHLLLAFAGIFSIVKILANLIGLDIDPDR